MSPQVRIGFVLGILGLLIALTALLPGPYSSYGILPVFAGGLLYVPSAFAVFFGSERYNRNRAFNQIRMIRLGFLVVIAIILAKLMSGAG